MKNLEVEIYRFKTERKLFKVNKHAQNREQNPIVKQKLNIIPITTAKKVLC